MKRILSLLVCLFALTAITTLSAQELAIGDKAPAFELKNIDGTMVSLDSYEDANGYIVVFTCNHCPYAVAYEERLIELHNTYAEKGWPVIAINPNDPEIAPGDSYEAMQERSKEMGFPFAYVFDSKQEVFPAYGATKTPHVFLLDKEKVVRYIGAIDDNYKDETMVRQKYVEMAIKQIELGLQPEPATTKAIGCSIKYAKD